MRFLFIALLCTIAVLILLADTDATSNGCAQQSDAPPVYPSAAQLAAWPNVEKQIETKQLAQPSEAPDGEVAGVPAYTERPWLDLQEPQIYAGQSVGGAAGVPEVRC